MPQSYDDPRHRGVVAVVARDRKYLVIRRSENVIAPGMICFPGGGIEGDESEEQTLVREFREELGATIKPLRRIWRSVTPWNVELAWWLGRLDNGQSVVANPAEVASIHWCSLEEIRGLPNLLRSMNHFLAALDAGEIDFRREYP